MKKCWDINPDNRSNAIKIYKLIVTFRNYLEKFKEAEKIEKQIFHFLK